MFRQGLARFKKRPLYFLHINKTAGTTITAAFTECMRRKGAERFLMRERVCGPQEFEGLGTLPPNRFDSYSLYRGHFGLILPQLLNRPCHIVTVLRDPVQRIISHFHHIQRSPDRVFYQRITENKMSLMDCLDDEEIAPVFWNMQARHLGWMPDKPKEKLAQFNYEPWDNPQSLPCKTDETTLIQCARRTLDEADVVGITEQLPKFFNALNEEFQLDLKPPSEHRMVGNYAAEYNPEERERIKEFCILDQEIYDYALARVDRAGG